MARSRIPVRRTLRIAPIPPEELVPERDGEAAELVANSFEEEKGVLQVRQS